ncbi:MAG TPA: replication factor C large subunit [Candidatus Woesearchaeota archaeon]|nr:replication factor C large subunit [Candidatus Woesearchaeota archaeon]
MSWTREFEPKSLSEVVGQEKGISRLRGFLNDYSSRKSKKKALLITGPTGVGKTCSVHAAARELGLEIVEMNASDFRNRDNIKSIMGNAAGQASLFFKSKIILIDEIDGISGTKDYGGAKEISRVLEVSSFPVIFTANDSSSKSLSEIRKKSVSIEFTAVNYTDILKRLQHICSIKKISYDEPSLKKIAIAANGDMRSAINDLMIASAADSKVDNSSIDFLYNRDRQDTIAQALVKIIKAKSFTDSSRALENVNVDFDEAMLWIEEAAIREYKKPADIQRALDSLSKADIFRKRIRRWQYWRLLVYQIQMMTAGVSLAKEEKYRKQSSFSRPKRLLMMWIYANKARAVNEASRKLARKMMTSSLRIRQSFVPYIGTAVKRSPRLSRQLMDEYELSSEEVAALAKNAR